MIRLDKPLFVSDMEQKTRPAMKVITLYGKGDPSLSFDNKLVEIHHWLKTKRISPSNTPSLGIFYKSRNEVGVENVEWDACVPVDDKVETESYFKYQELSEANVVSVILTGEYGLIGQALSWMENETKIKGIKMKWPLTEIYLKKGENPITELQYFIDEN